MGIESGQLKDSVALVTGGASGIGLATAQGLAEQGVRVVIASRRTELLHRVAQELNARHLKGRVYPYVFDIRNAQQTELLLRWVIDTFGRIDILVNNAGVADHSSITQLSDSSWDYVMETNLRGMMWLIRGALPSMMERNTGDIINVCSQCSVNGYPDVPAYCASKHAMLGLARSVDADLKAARRNVRIFNLLPSLVDVVNVAPGDVPRPGTVHVQTIVKTILYCLTLDRNVRLGDLDILAE